jgi:ABC-type transporter MlaC component
MNRFYAVMLLAVSLCFAAPAAAANQAAEDYVTRNANAAMQALQAPSAVSREAKFRELFQQFADFSTLSNFVLGRQGAEAIRKDPKLNSDWQKAFLDYATAVYQRNFDQFRGSTFEVTESLEKTAGKDVIVTTRIIPRNSTRAMTVNWRIVNRGNGAWKVTDVAIVGADNQLWLAQQFKRDFAPILGKDGDVRALIDALNAKTASMRAQLSK